MGKQSQRSAGGDTDKKFRTPLARKQLEAQGIKVVEKVDKRIGMMD
jgi:hypothetical protein